MKNLVDAFPQHLLEALEIGNNAQFRPTDRAFSHIVISGLGGSGIGGKIVSQVLADACSLPILCYSDYVLPAFVGVDSLVIISSYSGDTEETLAAMHEALARGAEVACVTSGGKIGQIAAERGLNHIIIPGGNPPRSMLGYSLIQLFFVLHRYGYCGPGFSAQVKAAVSLLHTEHHAMEAWAREVAARLVTRIPVLYSEASYEGLAIRWRQQINENAKMLCWHHVFPEMNHNELVGWTGADNRIAVLLLRNADDHPRSQIRMDLCKKLMSEKCDTLIEVFSKGESRLERTLYLNHLGDLLSIELAVLRNEDPVAIPAIIYLKNALSKV
jgi:glucose/mannose-6-phosphate isomerase